MYRLILTNKKSERESISLLMLVIGQLSKPRASFWNKIPREMQCFTGMVFVSP
ncbi:unnamed protein product [Salmonella enterica subsp. enterica serovar Typhimurium]|nr:unnamed protein product [Salmonella enterica subsp. enterica serovar Typhimurium]